MDNNEFTNQEKPDPLMKQTAPIVPMGGSGNEHKNDRGPFELSEDEQKKNGKNRLVQNAEQTASHANKIVQGRTQTQKPAPPSPGRG